MPTLDPFAMAGAAPPGWAPGMPPAVASAAPPPSVSTAPDGVATVVVTPHPAAPPASAPAAAPAQAADPFAMAGAAPPGWAPPGADAPQSSGRLANFGAGAVNALANAVETIPQLELSEFNATRNLVNHLFGTNLNPTDRNPGLAGDTARTLAGTVGLDPRTVVADGDGDRLARAAGAGAMSFAMMPEGGLAGVLRGIVPGMLGGLTGQTLADAAPDKWKPAADLLGNVLGGGIGHVAQTGVGALARGAGTVVRNQIPPLTMGGLEAAAARRVLNAATDPASVRAAVNTPAPDLVPSSQPTSFQVTGDPGLGTLERAVAKNYPEQFITRANQQNAARVGALGGLAPAGSSPDAVVSAFRNRLAAIDAAGGQAEQQAASGVNRALDQVGGAQTFSPDQAQTALQSYGADLRAPLVTANDAQRQAERQLWQQVDPDNTLRLDMTPIRQAANTIVKAMPANAAPMSGEESAIFGTARLLPQVQPFAELGALRSRLTSAIRAERMANGNTPTVSRLTQLLDSVHDTMDDAVRQAAEHEDGIGLQNETGLTSPPLPGDGDGRILGNGGTEGVLRPATGEVPEGPGSSEASPPAASGVGEGLFEGPGGRLPPQAGGSDDAGNSGVQPQGRRNVADGDRTATPSGAKRPGTPGSNPPLEAFKTNVDRPRSLLYFLTQFGGIKDIDGDLRAMDAHKQRIGLMRRADGNRGMTPDYARERAEEAGYLKAGSTTTDLYNAIAQELKGQKVYPHGYDGGIGQSEAEARDIDLHEHRVEQASGQLDDLLERSGHVLTPDEHAHAVDLIVQGEHPEEAVRQVLAAGDYHALDMRAQRDAFEPFPGLHPDAVQMPTGANFDAKAAQRYAAARAATAKRYAMFGTKVPGVGAVLRPGQRAGEFRLGDSQVPSTLFSAGKGVAERVQAYRAAHGDMAKLKDYAAFSLRRAAVGNDGTINPSALKRWLAAHKEGLDAAGFGADFANVGKAQAALDDAVARRAAAVKAYETSAASHFLGDADPVARVGRILRSDTAVAQMKELARLTANDPAARAGLQRAVVEHLLRDLTSNNAAGDTGTMLLKSDAFQTFVKRAAPALRQIFPAEHVELFQKVAADLQRSNRSIAGTKLPGGSNTAQDFAAGRKHLGEHGGSGFGMIMMAEALGQLGEHAGNLVFGAGHALLGHAAGLFLLPVFKAFRERGLASVNDKVAELMLDPAALRTALARVKPDNAQALGKLLAHQLMHRLPARAALATIGGATPPAGSPQGFQQ